MSGSAKAYVLERLPVKAYFEEKLKIARSGHRDNNLQAHCPFHDDKNPSFSVCYTGPKKGLVQCFAPSCGKKGDIYWFIGEMEGISNFNEILKFAAQLANVDLDVFYGRGRQGTKEFVLPPISPSKVEDPHKDLITKPDFGEKLKFLQEKRGLTIDQIKMLKIGFTKHYHGRFTIPIFGPNQEIWNIRYYKPGETKYGKFIHHQFYQKIQGQKDYKKHTYHRPFHCYTRWEWLRDPECNFIVIAAGELDTAVLIQNGIPAFCELAGEGSWSGQNNHYFENKIVIVAYDNDESGEVGGLKVVESLKDYAKEIRVIKWPSSMPTSGDVTDYFVTLQKTKDDFMALAESLKPYVQKGSDGIDVIQLYDVLRCPDNYNEFHKVTVNITAISPDSFTIPEYGCINCSKDVKCKAIHRCPVQKTPNIKLHLNFKKHPKSFLAYISHSRNSAQEAFKRANDIPKGCFQSVEFSPNVYSSIETRVSESIDTNNPVVSAKSDTSATLFYIGNEKIKENSKYTFTTKAEASPKDHKTLLCSNHAVPELNNLDNFKVGSHELDLMNEFKVKSGGSAVDHVQGLATYISINILKMVGSLTTAHALLTTIWTPQNFSLAGQFMHRGWGQALVIGDQGTGKSESFRRYNEFCPTYELLEGANTTIAGLIGGMGKGERVDIFSQGILPRNDLGMVGWDEFKKTNKEIMGLLTGIRSEGVIRYTKMIQRTMMARVRMLLYTSPPGILKLKQFNPPIKAALGVFHNSREDVRRLDNIFLLHEDEVLAQQINNLESLQQRVPEIFTPEHFKVLTAYAWTRCANNIWIHPESEKYILSEVLRLGDKYTADIPLIDPKSYRFKLAKMAISMAILCASFNTKEEEREVFGHVRPFNPGECLIVNPDHVDAYVKGILEPHMDSDKVGLLEYTIKEKSEAEIAKDHLDLHSLFFTIFPKLELSYAKFLSVFFDRQVKDLEALRIRVSPGEPLKANYLIDFLSEKFLLRISRRDVVYDPEKWPHFMAAVKLFYKNHTNAVIEQEAKYSDTRSSSPLANVTTQGTLLEDNDSYRKEDEIEI